MRCFVTGATGHLGSFLVRRLLADGNEVAILRRPTSDLVRLRGVVGALSHIQGDLNELASVQTQLSEFKPEITFHLAWDGTTGDFRNSPEQVSRNGASTLALLEVVRRAGSKVFVGLGSQAEYGLFSGVLREDHPPKPMTTYGLVKYCMSLLTLEFCTRANMRGLWLRIFSVYGPMDDHRHMLPTLISSLLDGQSPAVTLGEQRWDYLYVDDAVDAICAAAFTPDLTGVFNVAAGHATPLRQIVEQVRDIIDSRIQLRFGAEPYRPDQVMHLEGDISRLTAATAWTPQTSLEEGLRRTIAWTRENRPMRK
jgi:UDP-glucose 4-epimerase